MHKRTIVKEEKNQIPCYCASTEENSAGFLANHFCTWFPAEAGRRPLAPGLCTGFTCSKHATLALKPFGAGLRGCDCRGHSSYCSIRGILWWRLAICTWYAPDMHLICTWYAHIMICKTNMQDYARTSGFLTDAISFLSHAISHCNIAYDIACDI